MNQPARKETSLYAAPSRKHTLPELPYEHGALEPCIDLRTMMLHHDVHHGGYVEKLNAALEKFPDFQEYSALWLLRNLDRVPQEIRTAVHQNAGGHVNHSLFWCAMKPNANPEPVGLLHDAINRDFGSLDKFKTKFEEAGTKLFGSGWVWLVRKYQRESKLEIITTSGHDHPIMRDRYPILLNDVWEHAYYLKYENRRADYLKAWWSLCDWEEAGRRFESGDDSSEDLLEDEKHKNCNDK